MAAHVLLVNRFLHFVIVLNILRVYKKNSCLLLFHKRKQNQRQGEVLILVPLGYEPNAITISLPCLLQGTSGKKPDVLRPGIAMVTS